MLPNHTKKVVECFAKLTDGIPNNNIYIPTDEAKTIIKAGRNSTDTVVNENAERALNKLLQVGNMEFTTLVTDKDQQVAETDTT